MIYLANSEKRKNYVQLSVSLAILIEYFPSNQFTTSIQIIIYPVSMFFSCYFYMLMKPKKK